MDTANYLLNETLGCGSLDVEALEGWENSNDDVDLQDAIDRAKDDGELSFNSIVHHFFCLVAEKTKEKICEIIDDNIEDDDTSEKMKDWINEQEPDIFCNCLDSHLSLLGINIRDGREEILDIEKIKKLYKEAEIKKLSEDAKI